MGTDLVSPRTTGIEQRVLKRFLEGGLGHLVAQTTGKVVTTTEHTITAGYADVAIDWYWNAGSSASDDQRRQRVRPSSKHSALARVTHSLQQVGCAAFGFASAHLSIKQADLPGNSCLHIV